MDENGGETRASVIPNNTKEFNLSQQLFSLSLYTSVFQPGFRGISGFRQFLTGFPANPQISTILSI